MLGWREEELRSAGLGQVEGEVQHEEPRRCVEELIQMDTWVTLRTALEGKVSHTCLSASCFLLSACQSRADTTTYNSKISGGHSQSNFGYCLESICNKDAG